MPCPHSPAINDDRRGPIVAATGRVAAHPAPALPVQDDNSLQSRMCTGIGDVGNGRAGGDLPGFGEERGCRGDCGGRSVRVWPRPH
ncbi:hypothetical protein FRAAL6194 [Frankia alni ACN14a]|uniref:Uncharacterized protein n=1 Tax=Frankia alni (strain DSM 45986 / CECT 9034 / ACN14a) TaxID=326424 RepID=Q0RCK7_FRAAA|nr:hypothetical protein FRAAL6194 [Frankia alni ACN14a]